MPKDKEFGKFFRRQRLILGLKLREFCQLNGYDVGNISKLERGILPPPRSAEALDSYAKALKLDPRLTDQFKRLAAAENAGIRFETLRSVSDQRSRFGTWTNATDLELWANYLDSRSMLSHLARRLIRGTVDSIERIDLPAGEASQRPGWDGVVVTSVGNEFIPVGISGVELGVDKNPRRKAETELQKRTKNPLGVDPSQACFIFITPRKWNDKKNENKAQWCSKHKEAGVWRDIRVYDSTDLEAWLELTPVVDAWFARYLGKRVEGVIDIENHWMNLAELTEPQLKPEVFLTSREKNGIEFEEWLAGPPSSLAIEAPSPIDIIDFLSAYVMQLSASQRETKVSRILIVKKIESWEAISTTRVPLLLIADPRIMVDPELVSDAVRHGHHVLLCSHRFAGERSVKFDLSVPCRYDLESALVDSGLKENKASQMARESGGSLTILKRLLARFERTRQPEWSRALNAEEIIPFLLVGGWDGANSADQSILEKLSGRSYHENLSTANKWLNSNDPPLMQVLTRWSLVSREDSWVLLARYLTDIHLDRFEETALEVLKENDPKYDLPPGERWRAAIYDKRTKFSPELRKGISETLALLAIKSSSGLVKTPIENAQRSEKIVRKLLDDNLDWQRWASMSWILPVLAEACPDVFMSAVEIDLRKNEPELIKLFVEEGPPLFSSQDYTGSLWALETLAWEPSYLSRVTYILAHLAEKIPAEKSKHRAINTLQQIFLPWMPRTMASVERRVEVLTALTRRNPEIGWKLLIDLLPTGHGVSLSSHRPAWRNWSINWPGRVTNAEYWQQVEACSMQLIDLAGKDIDRWTQLVEEFDRFHKPIQERILTDLSELDANSYESSSRKKITQSLRQMVRKHKNYSESRWAMPLELVDKLEAIQRKFEPHDIVDRNLWLFEDNVRFVADQSESWERREQNLFQMRKLALNDIIESGGFKKVFQLIEQAKSARSVGISLGKANMLDKDSGVLPVLLDSDDKNQSDFALGYVWGCIRTHGWSWVEKQPISKWSTKQAGEFTKVMDFERKTWKLVESLGEAVKNYYWQNVRSFLRTPQKGDVDYAVVMLNRHERPSQALEVLEMAIHGKCNTDSSLIMDTLENLLDKREKSESERTATIQSSCNAIQYLFEYLQADQEVDPDRLVKLEWAYLPLLDGYGGSPETLYKLLQSEPEFFAQLISLSFLPEEESTERTTKPTEEEQQRAKNAYRLLMQWREIPGRLEGDVIDEQLITTWFKVVRDRCRKSKRLGVCDIHIGEIFAHSPPESDGSWPCIPIRDLIESTYSDELVRGFKIGIHNKRGVCTRSPTEGGEQERKLAEEYKGYAKACEVDWPAMAAALEQVAKEYENEARYEDERARERLLRDR